jgi:hypothetical protein
MEGADLCRCGIKSEREAGEPSPSVFERGGELIGRCIVGIGESEVRAGRGVREKGCKLEANFGGTEVSQVSLF